MSRTIIFKNKPIIIGASTIAGPKESEGSIAKYFDVKLSDDTYGENSFEKSESKLSFTAIKNSILNASLKENDVDVLLAGDLLDQIIASTFAARNFNFGYLGLYNACATFTQSLSLGPEPLYRYKRMES